MKYNFQLSIINLQKIFNAKIFNLNWKLATGNWKFRRGFTMVELLIYMGILAILLGVLSGIFSSIINVQLESRGASSTQIDGRFILSRLNYDIHRVSGITSPTLGNQANFLTASISGQTVTYSLDANNDLVRTDATGTDQLNSYDTTVDAITFRQIGNSPAGKNTVQVTYTLRSRAQSTRGADVKTYTTTIGMR
jgi:prepilin-type N-terminal cleavage/methylation domain-containing protein